MSRKSKFLYIFPTIILLFSLNSCSTVRLVGFHSTDCIEYCKYGLIENTKYDGKSLITYGIGAPCSLEFTGNVKYKNDTLFLIAIMHTDPAICRCGYELTYEIKGIETDICEVVLIKKWDQKNKYREFATTNRQKYDRISKRKRNRHRRKYNRIDQKEERKYNRKINQQKIKKRNITITDDVYN